VAYGSSKVSGSWGSVIVNISGMVVTGLGFYLIKSEWEG
jgi:hypothetical protein